MAWSNTGNTGAADAAYATCTLTNPSDGDTFPALDRVLGAGDISGLYETLEFYGYRLKIVGHQAQTGGLASGCIKCKQIGLYATQSPVAAYAAIDLHTANAFVYDWGDVGVALPQTSDGTLWFGDRDNPTGLVMATLLRMIRGWYYANATNADITLDAGLLGIRLVLSVPTGGTGTCTASIDHLAFVPYYQTGNYGGYPGTEYPATPASNLRRYYVTPLANGSQNSGSGTAFTTTNAGGIAAAIADSNEAFPMTTNEVATAALVAGGGQTKQLGYAVSVTRKLPSNSWVGGFDHLMNHGGEALGLSNAYYTAEVTGRPNAPRLAIAGGYADTWTCRLIQNIAAIDGVGLEDHGNNLYSWLANPWQITAADVNSGFNFLFRGLNGGAGNATFFWDGPGASGQSEPVNNQIGYQPLRVSWSNASSIDVNDSSSATASVDYPDNGCELRPLHATISTAGLGSVCTSFTATVIAKCTGAASRLYSAYLSNQAGDVLSNELVTTPVTLTSSFQTINLGSAGSAAGVTAANALTSGVFLRVFFNIPTGDENSHATIVQYAQGFATTAVSGSARISRESRTARRG